MTKAKSAAPDMRELTVVYRDPASLTDYENNSRTHSPEQIEKLRASIREFGFTNPILLKNDDTTIGAGHARNMAALAEGLDRVPTITLHGLSDAQWRAYVIADNQLALTGSGWDEDILRTEMEALAAMDFDMPVLGFDAEELAGLLAEKTEGLTDPDEIPEAPIEPVAKPGDVWLLGKHRLVCGDSTSADVVATLLQGAKPHLMVTDPPYGVEYDANWRNTAKRPDGTPYGASAVGPVANDERADWREAWALFPGDVAYVWHAGNMAHVVAESLIACTLNIRAQIIWAKSNMVISRGDYHPKHEPCWYAVRKGAKGHWAGDRKQTTVWDIPKPQKSETGHSTQKPVECMKRPIENNSKPGDAVYEPFSGSGTTIIAAEMTGRSVHAIELNPAYVDVTIKRWQDFTGSQAVHAETGQTFAQVARERGIDHAAIA